MVQASARALHALSTAHFIMWPESDFFSWPSPSPSSACLCLNKNVQMEFKNRVMNARHINETGEKKEKMKRKENTVNAYFSLSKQRLLFQLL